MTSGETDLVIVGAGTAGLTAARRAQQLGLRVIVLEKSPEPPGLGSGRISGGVFHAAYLDPRKRSTADIASAIHRVTSGQARPDLLATFTSNVARALGFLEAEGGTFRDGRTGLPWWGNTLQPMADSDPQPPGDGIAAPFSSVKRWRGAGPDRLLTGMWQRFTAEGGDFRLGEKALELLVEQDAVVGVRTRGGDIRGAAVLISDGGFHSDPAFAKQYFGSDGYLVRGSDMNTGDGLRMAIAAGAVPANPGQFYGHIMHGDVVTDHRMWFAMTDHLCEGGLVVTARGRRLGGTGPTFMHLISEIVRSESPRECWVVADRLGVDALTPKDNAMRIVTAVDGRTYRAGTLDELAGLLRIGATALGASVATHNAHCAVAVPMSSWDGLAHPMPAPVPIAQPPFFAMPIAVGITLCLGGILVNGSGRALNTRGSPIPGLYAAGGSMGGLQGGPDHGYVGGWSQATVFGLAVAEDVAKTRSIA